jgi:hypothetical protein
MVPTRTQIEQHARQTTARMTKFAKERFSIPALNFDLRFNANEGGTSRAVYTKGRYFVSLCHGSLLKYPVIGMREYARFNDSRTHGSIRTSDWQLYVDTVLAHEIAHIVQFWLKREPNTLIDLRSVEPGSNPFFGEFGFYEGAHGHFFQALYKVMREEFINPRVEMRDRGQRIDQEFDKPASEKIDHSIPSSKDCPLTGCQFTINGRGFEVIGYNDNDRKKLYKYKAKEVRTGKVFSVQLGDIVRTGVLNSRPVIETINTNPVLTFEMRQFNDAKGAVMQAKVTRKRRQNFKNLAFKTYAI